VILPTFPGDCAWCGEPASERVHVSGRGMSKVYALACADHAHGKKVLEVAHTRAATRREPEVLERTEPLCQSCGAEVTWVSSSRTASRASACRSTAGR
jgi:predicted Zn-ribbon and HTH transcriptional regulator